MISNNMGQFRYICLHFGSVPKFTTFLLSVQINSIHSGKSGSTVKLFQLQSKISHFGIFFTKNNTLDECLNFIWMNV